MNNLDDDGKLYNKYLNKRNNAKKEGIECLLSYDEFCFLVEQAGLKSSDLGFSGKKYVLARYNDEGNYTINNCRFITHHENMMERKISIKAHNSSSKNIQKYNKNRDSYIDKEELAKRIKIGQNNSEKIQKIREEQSQKRLEKELSKNPSYIKEHNSQYGTFWITDGKINKKWSDKKGVLPEGFYKGRIV